MRLAEPDAATVPSFLAGGGACGALIAARDWSGTPLGPVDGWPASLRTATAIMLRSSLPMALMWGAEGVLLYNDGYAAIAGGRHPALLGAPVREGWPEVAAFNDNVVRTGLAGGTLRYRDQEMTLDRNGAAEQVWFDLDYSPVPGDDGRPAGVLGIILETTERLRAERRSAGERERLRRMFAQAPGLLAMLSGPDHVFEMANPGYLALVGDRELIGRPLAQAVPEIVEQGFVGVLDEVYRTGKPFVGTAVPIANRRLPDGELELRRYDFVYQPLVDEEGRVTGIFAEGQDVTERVAAETRLRESEAELRAITDALPVLVAHVDRDLTYRFVNRAYEEWFGRPREEIVGRRLDDLLGPERAASLSGCVARVLGGERAGYAHRGDYGVKGERSIEADYLPRFAADGTVEGFYVLIADVTERRAAADALRTSEARLRAVLDGVSDGFYALDDELRLIVCNRAAGAYLGLDPAAAIGRSVIEAVGREDTAETRAGFVRRLEQASAAGPTELRSATRPDRFVELRAARLSDGGWAVSFTDVTERRRAEDELRRLNAELEARVAAALAERRVFADIVEGTEAVVQVVGPDLKLLAVNKAAADASRRIFGYALGPGDHVLDRLADLPDEQEKARRLWTRALGGESFTEVVEVGPADGERRWYELAFSPLRDAEGAINGAFQFAADVTERVRDQERLAQAEEALRQAQKMEAVGQLTGGIAHDFNNLLGAVVGSLDLIRRRPDDLERVKRYAEAGLQAAERGAKLTGQLLAFSRAQRIELKPLVPAELVEGMRDLLQRTLGPMVRLRFELDTDGAPVLSDPTQLEMAVLNLAINARDAMPDGGELRFASAVRRVDGDPELAPGEYVELAVSDTGTGMAPEVAARAFDPFFTTKGVGKGTGLGLSQVYGIARQAGGAVRIDSRPGEGTTVRILLPRTELAVGAPDERGGGADAGAASQARVLVVDDDPDMRRMLVESLDALGYRVDEAADGPAGLRALEAARPDVLMVDFAMPGMNGAEVARAARARRPDLPVVFATGYADTAAIEAAVGPDAPVLRKPFRVADLQAVLSAVLGAALTRG